MVELLVATSILTVMTLFLVAMANQASRIWSQEQAREQHRQRARAALGFIGRELRAATLPVVTDAAKPSLQFIINPNPDPATANRDSIFWQAPVATDTTKGNLAEIGYFVRWDTTRAGHPQANLCRFFVNPLDTSNYLIYSNPSSWTGNDVLNSVAPADKSHQYRGLFLENVIGFWVQGRLNVGTTDTDYATACNNDSRATAARPYDQLPGYVEMSLALLDSYTAGRVGDADVATIQGLYTSSASNAGTAPRPAALAANFVQALPPALRGGASVVNIKVSLDNYHAN